MKPGHGEVLLAEGDVEVPEEEALLIAEFRRQLDSGMWAAVPLSEPGGRREAELVRRFEEIPRDAERVIFFPRAAGGSGPARQDRPACSVAARDAAACTRRAGADPPAASRTLAR
jgi:hypothetical protein